jgi:C4-dicarboxylate transporter DctM subunit
MRLGKGVDPVHLGILTALCIEIGSVIPPVGLNLFAVSGVTGLPVTQVIKGSFPFCISSSVKNFGSLCPPRVFADPEQS